MSHHHPRSMGRRRFLQQSASCGAYVATLAALSPLTTKRVFGQTQGDVVAKEKWGRIEKIADSAWALISDLSEDDFTTVCNGGILAGDKGVLAVETFMRPRGAQWLAEWAEKLTGRWPSDVIVSHYHADHSAGIAGYLKNGKSPRLWMTEKTQQLVEQSANPPKLPDVTRLQPTGQQIIDLGNRQVTVHPQIGHTDSDVSVELLEPNVLFAGDLFFNRMVPNYADAHAKQLTAEVAKLVRDKDTTYIPGHGPVAKSDDLQLYREFLDMIEAAVRQAHGTGVDAEKASLEFDLPANFADWYIFSPQVMPRAFAAWYRVLDAEKNGD